MGNQAVKVMFRVWRSHSRTVVAVFPYEEWKPGECTVYEHFGQHGGGDYQSLIEMTRPATDEEAEPLVKELERIGYELTRIKRRQS